MDSRAFDDELGILVRLMMNWGLSCWGGILQKASFLIILAHTP